MQLPELKYKRVLLKLSGEALAGEKKQGIDAETLGKICDQIKVLIEMKAEVAIVIGGGNFWRGKYGHQMERTTSDYMGMLATAMNGLALQDALEARGIFARLQTAIEMREIGEPYIQRKATKHLQKGRVVIFSCGTGNPYFTTDTAAALRAAEVNAEVILVGKTIDAVYSDDPKTNPNAVRYEQISYLDILNRDLKVMDATAISLCKENNIPLIVFGIAQPENMVKAIQGEKVGTFIQ
ncbi:MAG: UMP kinase [Clostridia bacterium]|nr:UMP kinase [Clostridia bacterium]